MTAYQDLILNNPAVCNNCLGRIRRDRAVTQSRDPTSVTTVQKSAYTRHERTTSVEHVPGGDDTTQSVAVFCECGVESAYHRLWEDGDDRCLRMARVKTLLKNCIRTLEAKGVTLDRGTFVRLALHYYREDHDFNAAVDRATEAAIETAAATGGDAATALSE